MFKKIDHVEIVTARPDETIAFYTDVLGFRVKLRERLERPGGTVMNLAYLELNGTSVELITYEGVPVNPQPEKEHLGYRLLALEVDDMGRTLDYLKGKGVAVTWGPRATEKYARAEITDPNGYSIELRHWLS